MSGSTDDHRVIGIASEAFAGLKGLRSVTIPGGVEELGARAFAQCTGLKRVAFGGCCDHIRADAFLGCDAIEEVRFFSLGAYCDTVFSNKYSNPAYFADKLYFGGELLSDCLTLSTKANNGRERYKIPAHAFCGSNITALIVEEGVRRLEIERGAFAECDSLSTVILADSLRSFDPAGLLSLSSIKYNEYAGLRYLGSRANPYKALVDIAEPDTTYVVHPDTELICATAFLRCREIKTIFLPANLIGIEHGAFDGCDALERVVLSESADRFEPAPFLDCKSLVYNEYGGLRYLGSQTNPYKAVVNYIEPLPTYELHPDTQIICPRAFANNSQLAAVTIPQSVTNIGVCAFIHCKSLKTIDLPPVKRIESVSFGSCTALENVHMSRGTEWIGRDAFSDCSALTAVELPPGLKYIGENAFKNCSSLVAVDIPDDVTLIGESAFSNCRALRIVHMPAALKSLDDKAFRDCRALESVSLPALEHMGSEVFMGCSSLKSACFADGIKYIGGHAFSECKNLERVELSKGLENIYSNAFEQCFKLHEIKLPDGLKYIGYYAFYCSGLFEIDIPCGVTGIAWRAFARCPLKKAVIPDSVVKMGYGVFMCCPEELRIVATDEIRAMIEEADKSQKTVNRQKTGDE